jgi:hypothetical protein
MIETTAHMAVFLLICFAVFLVLAIVGGRFLEKVGQSLRGWLG